MTENLKIEMALGPEGDRLIGEPRIGDMYPVRGGSGLRYGHLHVLVSINERTRMCYFLTVNSQGEIVGTYSLGTHVIEDRVPVARVEGFESMQLTMRSL